MSPLYLEHLKGLTKLRELYLHDTQVTEAGAAELRRALPRADVWSGYIGCGTDEE